MAGKAPVLKLEAFPLRAAVWENDHVSTAGKSFKTFSIKLTKSFKDDKGQWQETQSLSDRDLLGASALLLEVWRSLCVKQKESAPGSGLPTASQDDGERPF